MSQAVQLVVVPSHEEHSLLQGSQLLSITTSLVFVHSVSQVSMVVTTKGDEHEVHVSIVRSQVRQEVEQASQLSPTSMVRLSSQLSSHVFVRKSRNKEVVQLVHVSIVSAQVLQFESQGWQSLLVDT